MNNTLYLFKLKSSYKFYSKRGLITQSLSKSFTAHFSNSKAADQYLLDHKLDSTYEYYRLILGDGENVWRLNV